MKHKQLNNRMDKIKFLQNIKEGKATIQELMPVKVEFWTGCDSEPDNYINEDTGERITTAELDTRKQAAGSKTIFFIELRSDCRDEPIV